MESLLSRKSDVNTVLDWLKDVEVGPAVVRRHTSDASCARRALCGGFYEVTRRTSDCKQNFELES